MKRANNYARPAPRVTMMGNLSLECAPIACYRPFHDSDGIPVAVLADPSAWVLHHIPAGKDALVRGVHVVGRADHGVSQ